MNLGNLFNGGGHVYATSQGYIHIHYYSSIKEHANYVANLLLSKPIQHQSVYKVVVARRRELQFAAERLLFETDLNELHRARLTIALRYARNKFTAERRVLAELLRSKTPESAT